MPPQNKPAVARRFSFESATVWALIATIILATIAFIPSPSVPFMYTKVFILAMGGIVTLALYILARLTRGNVILPPILMVGALWLPPLAYALSTVFSGMNQTMATFGTNFEPDTFGFVTTIAFLGTLAAVALRRVEHYQVFLKAGAYAAAFIVAVQVMLLVLGQFMPETIAPTASIVGSFADLGTLAGLIVVIALLTLRLLPVSPRARLALAIVGALALF